MLKPSYGNIRHEDYGAGSDLGVGQNTTMIFLQIACKHQGLLMGGHPTNGVVVMNLGLDIGDGGVMRNKRCHVLVAHGPDRDDKHLPQRVSASSHDARWRSEEADQSHLLVMPRGFTSEVLIILINV